MKEKVISLFVYLLTRYRAEKQKSFKFTFHQVKAFLNIGTSRSTDYIVTDMLLVLKKLELVDYECRTEVDEDGSVKTVYWITNMNNKIVDEG